MSQCKKEKFKYKFTCPQCCRQQDVEIVMNKSSIQYLNIGHCQCVGCMIHLEITTVDIHQEWAKAEICGDLK